MTKSVLICVIWEACGASGTGTQCCSYNSSLCRCNVESKQLPPCYCHHYCLTGKKCTFPVFPRYETQWFCQDKLTVFWFEVDFSQTHYNDDEISNACTLIVLLMTAYCSNDQVHTMCTHNGLCNRIIHSLGIAMLTGNRIYNRFKQLRRLPNVNLSVPEAIFCAGKLTFNIKEWRCILTMQPMARSLLSNLQNNLDKWDTTEMAHRCNYLFIILISDSRSVLFIVNREDDTITFVDSHVHSCTKGAVIAVVRRRNISCLCYWLLHIWCKYYNNRPPLYELSFLYYEHQ